MTNTTDKKSKPTKSKGPLRLEAILPLTILILLVGGYSKYFLDGHLRRGLEWGLTQSYGAEVNIGSLKILFLEPSIRIRNIQVTDKTDPKLNLVQIGEIKLQLLWDALLRGKFVIPESSILEIQAKSPRRRPGRILPPKADQGGKSAVSKAAEQTVNQLREKNEANLLGDLFAVAGGTNYQDQLKKLEGEIKTQARIKSLGEELKNKEKEWQTRIDSLPDESEIKQLTKKIEGLKINTKDPKSIQASLKEIDQVYKEAKAKYKTVEEAKRVLSQDLKTYEKEYKALENLIEEDIQGLANKLNIPSLDPQEINKMLLGALIANQLGSLAKYQEMAREYMPVKGAKKKGEELTPRQRASGVDYAFPKGKSYPRFWLQKAQISSNSKEGEAGDLSGVLRNLTDNPKHLGLPATLDLKGGFPKQQILDVVAKLTVDHTTDNEVENGFLQVGQFPIGANTLSRSSDLSLGYGEAKGSSRIDFELRDEMIKLNSQTLMKQVQYVVEAKEPRVKSLVEGVVSSLTDLDLNLSAEGSWTNPRLRINSSLGDRLVAAVRGQIEAEIKKGRAQIEAHVKGLVGKEKAKLDEELKKIESKLGVNLKSREDAVNSVNKSLDDKKKEVSQSQKKEIDKVKKEAGKKVQDLLKGKKLKF